MKFNYSYYVCSSSNHILFKYVMTVDEHSEMTKDITEYRWNITPLAFTQKDGRKISVAWLGEY